MSPLLVFLSLSSSSSSLSLSFCSLGGDTLVAGPGLHCFPLRVLPYQIFAAASCLLLLLCILVLTEGSGFTVKLMGCNFSNILKPLSQSQDLKGTESLRCSMFLFFQSRTVYCLITHGFHPFHVTFFDHFLCSGTVLMLGIPGLTRQCACSQIFCHLCLENAREFINY